MKNFFKLLHCEALKLWRMTLAYPLNVAIGIIAFVAIAVAAMFGVSVVFEDVHYFYCLLLTPILTNSIASISNSYKFDTMVGVIEQIATSTFGLRRVFFARYCIDFIISVIPTALLLILAKLILRINVNIISCTITVMLFFVGGYCIGLLLYGLVLVFRKIDSISGILNGTIVALSLLVAVVGVSNLSILVYIIPFSSYVILPSLPFDESLFNPVNLIAFLSNFMVSCCVAYICYAKLYNVARKNGTIGQY